MDEYRPLDPYLNPSQKVLLIHPGEEDEEPLKAKLYDWSEEDITLSGLEDEHLRELETDLEYILRVFTDRGVLEFQAEIRDMLKASGNLILSRPKRARRIQRRRFLRMDIEGELKVEPGDEDQELDPIQELGTLNISANGIRFVTDRKDFNLSSRYDLFIHIEFEEGPSNPQINSMDVEVTGEVVRMAGIHREGQSLYEVAMKFVELDQQIQDNLVSFLLRYQLHLRRHEVDVT